MSGDTAAAPAGGVARMASIGVASFIRQDTLDIRARRPDIGRTAVMSAAQVASPVQAPQMLQERQRSRKSQAMSSNRGLIAPGARAAISNPHVRRPSQFYGSTILATEATLDGPAFTPRKATPLDEVPPLFPQSALDALSQETPYLQDVQTIVNTLQAITQESSVVLGADAVDAAANANNITVPNVAVGWSGNRRQAVSEMMLQLSNAVDKLLVDQYPRTLSGPMMSRRAAQTLNPLANLRSEFLSSREILTLVHTHSHGGRLADMAPSLLALSKMYQNRLLEFQSMDELRLELEPEEKFKKKYEKARKQAEEAKEEERKAKETKEQKSNWSVARRKGRGSINMGSRSKRGSLIVPAGAAAANAASAATSSVSIVPPAPKPVTDSKWRRLENQGSLDHYLPWNLVKREMHLFAPQLVELTKIYWRACFMDENGRVRTGVPTVNATGGKLGLLHKKMHARTDSNDFTTASHTEGGLLLGLPKKTYMHLYTLIHYILKPSYLPSYAQQVVSSDWLIDVHMSDRPKDAAKVLMTLPQFHLSLFNLIDIWTESVQLGEYVEFAKKLFEFITEEVAAPEAENEGAAKTEDRANRTHSLLEDSDEEAEIRNARTQSAAPISSVYRRRLKPLSLFNINNLRKLGLKSSTFQDLTSSMLEEIETKSRLASAHADAMEAARRGSMQSSDSTTSLSNALANLDDDDEVEKDYRANNLSVNKRVNLADMRPPSPTFNSRRPSPSGTPPLPLHHGRKSSIKSDSNDSVSSAALAPIMSQTDDDASFHAQLKLRPRPPPSPAQPVAAFPSWESLSQRTQKALPSPISAVPSSTSNVSVKRVAGHARKLSNKLKPSKAQESSEESKRAEEYQSTEDDFQQVDLDSEPFGPSSSPPAAKAANTKHKPRKSNLGKLSWRMPYDLDDEENQRAMREEFEAMKREHEAIKRAAAEKRTMEEEEGRVRIAELHDLEEESEEDEIVAVRKQKLKRGSSKRGSQTARPSAEPRDEEKDDGVKYSPFADGRTLSGSNAPPGSKSARGSKSAPFRPKTIESFEAQRRRFAEESAAYLERMERMRKHAAAQLAELRARGGPELPEGDHEVERFLREEFLLNHGGTSAAGVMARHAAGLVPIPRNDGAVLLSDGFTSPAFYPAVSPLGDVEPRSLLISRTTPSGDKRDRFWNLMPQGRVEALKQRATDAEAAAVAAEKVRSRPSTAHSRWLASKLHGTPSSRYCECYECTDLLLDNEPTRSGNGARAHAENIHDVLRSQVQVKSDRGFVKLQQMIERV